MDGNYVKVERAQRASVDTLSPVSSALDYVEFVCFTGLGLFMIGSLVSSLLASGCYGPSNIHSTQADARTLRQAMILYRAEQPDAGCPTVETLVEGHYIDPSMRLTDAWEQEFRLACRGRDVYASSAGPDGEFGTNDDLADPFFATLQAAGKSADADLRAAPSSRK